MASFKPPKQHLEFRSREAKLAAVKVVVSDAIHNLLSDFPWLWWIRIRMALLWSKC